MTSVLFLVNPALAYDPYPDWRVWAPAVDAGMTVRTTWNVGTRRGGMGPGDRGFIVKVGREPRGLVGAARITSGVWTGPHWNPEAARPETGYVDIDIVTLIDLDDPMTLDELRLIGPSVAWTPRQSGTRIDEDVADRLWEIIGAGKDRSADTAGTDCPVRRRI